MSADQGTELPKGKSTTGDPESVSVTVYNSNMGVIRDVRALGCMP